MHRLEAFNQVPQIVTYNITFKGEHNHHRDKDLSYVQLGLINKALEPNISYIPANDTNKYWTNTVFAYIAAAGEVHPVADFEGTKAIFDPSVDYMYVNELYFGYFSDQLKEIYKNITCNQYQCYFNVTDCDEVEKVNSTVTIGLGVSLPQSTSVELDLEDYMFVDKHPTDATAPRVCYFPLFVTEPMEDYDAFETWFLGNMFLDKYLVTHNHDAMSHGSQVP